MDDFQIQLLEDMKHKVNSNENEMVMQETKRKRKLRVVRDRQNSLSPKPIRVHENLFK